MSDDLLTSEIRARLTHFIEADPQVLLEHDGGPLGLKADIILATLYGFDEQVDAEWRIPRVESTLLRPITPRLSLTADDADAAMPTMRVARYELQSAWAALDVDWLHHRALLPADVKPSPGTYLVKVALVRYRRRT